jgi:hypothetical protein
MSDYISLDYMIISKWWMQKDVSLSCRDDLFEHFLEETKENHEKLLRER